MRDNKRGGVTGDTEIYIMNADGKQKMRITQNNSSDNELSFALSNPQEYEEGTTWDLGDGRQIVLVNGQWQEQ